MEATVQLTFLDTYRRFSTDKLSNGGRLKNFLITYAVTFCGNDVNTLLSGDWGDLRLSSNGPNPEELL